jgi:S-adenosylmethionine hydrolase
MIIAGGWLMYDHWEKSSEMVFVRVVDSGTQKVTEYRAYRGDIEERAFVTVDNVSVTLAATERLETSTKPLDQN